MTDFRQLSPFYEALHAGPLAAELPVSYVALLMVPLLATLAALPWWARRDIGRAR